MRLGLDPWVGKIPWRREWLTTPVFCPGEFHGERSLGGYSSWGCKELDTSKQLSLSLFKWLHDSQLYRYAKSIITFNLYNYVVAILSLLKICCNEQIASIISHVWLHLRLKSQERKLSQRISMLFIDIANLILPEIKSVFTPTIQFSVSLH